MDEDPDDEPGSDAQHLAALVLTTAPLLYLSYNFFGAWLHPLAPRNLSWVKDAPAIIWLEFVLAHAGVLAMRFLGVGLHQRTASGMLGFMLFYGMFIVAFSLVLDRAWMAVPLAALLFGRLYSASYAKHNSRPMLFARSFFTFLIFLACLFICTTFVKGWDAKTNLAIAKLLGGRPNPFYGQAAAACALYFFAIVLLELKFFFSPPLKLLARLADADTT